MVAFQVVIGALVVLTLAALAVAGALSANGKLNEGRIMQSTASALLAYTVAAWLLYVVVLLIHWGVA